MHSAAYHFDSGKPPTFHLTLFCIFCITSTNNRHWYYLTDVLQGGPVNGNWTSTVYAPFLYADGGSSPPLLLRNVPEQNYLDDSVQVAGWTLFGITALFPIMGLLFVRYYQSAPPIRQHQPFFLYLVLIGCLMMSMSILTFSFDEQDTDSKQILNLTCLASLWLICVGYLLVYAALFSKLLRINKVLQFVARRKVEVQHVIAPLIAAMVAVLVVLVVWSVHDPFIWVREEIDDFTGESYGQCQSENTLPYLVSVVGINFAATFAAAVMAWKTKDVDERFAEGKWIFYTIFAQLQLLALGIPVLVILDTASAEATYMGRALIILLVVVSTVSFMIGPKAYRVIACGEMGDRPAKVEKKQPPKLPPREEKLDQRSAGSIDETSRQGSHNGRQGNNSIGGSVDPPPTFTRNTSNDSNRLTPPPGGRSPRRAVGSGVVHVSVSGLPLFDNGATKKAIENDLLEENLTGRISSPDSAEEDGANKSRQTVSSISQESMLNNPTDGPAKSTSVVTT